MVYDILFYTQAIIFAFSVIFIILATILLKLNVLPNSMLGVFIVLGVVAFLLCYPALHLLSEWAIAVATP